MSGVRGLVALLGLGLAGLAWAGQYKKPATVDLNDLDRWADAAQTALIPPSGCWQVEGRYSWAVRSQGQGTADGEGSFQRTLRSGRWNSAIGAFDPMVGDAWGTSRSPSVAQLDRWLEPLAGPVETLTTDWDEDRGAVVVERRIGLDGGQDEAVARTWIGDDGKPELQRVTFPNHRLGPGQKLKGAGWDLRLQRTASGLAVPAEEHLVFRVIERGKVQRGHQSIWYERWSPCR